MLLAVGLRLLHNHLVRDRVVHDDLDVLLLLLQFGIDAFDYLTIDAAAVVAGFGVAVLARVALLGAFDALVERVEALRVRPAVGADGLVIVLGDLIVVYATYVKCKSK